MFQFETKLYTLQLLPLKTDVHFSTKRYFIREKHTKVQTTKFYECHSYTPGKLSLHFKIVVYGKTSERHFRDRPEGRFKRIIVSVVYVFVLLFI
jgi:uncharacterized protein (DUF1919 family)